MHSFYIPTGPIIGVHCGIWLYCTRVRRTFYVCTALGVFTFPQNRAAAWRNLVILINFSSTFIAYFHPFARARHSGRPQNVIAKRLLQRPNPIRTRSWTSARILTHSVDRFYTIAQATHVLRIKKFKNRKISDHTSDKSSRYSYTYTTSL